MYPQHTTNWGEEVLHLDTVFHCCMKKRWSATETSTTYDWQIRLWERGSFMHITQSSAKRVGFAFERDQKRVQQVPVVWTVKIEFHMFRMLEVAAWLTDWMFWECTLDERFPTKMENKVNNSQKMPRVERWLVWFFVRVVWRALVYILICFQELVNSHTNSRRRIHKRASRKGNP